MNILTYLKFIYKKNNKNSSEVRLMILKLLSEKIKDPYARSNIAAEISDRWAAAKAPTLYSFIKLFENIENNFHIIDKKEIVRKIINNIDKNITNFNKYIKNDDKNDKDRYLIYNNLNNIKDKIKPLIENIKDANLLIPEDDYINLMSLTSSIEKLDGVIVNNKSLDNLYKIPFIFDIEISKSSKSSSKLTSQKAAEGIKKKRVHTKKKKKKKKITKPRISRIRKP